MQNLQSVDTLIEAKWIIPIEPANEVLNDYALVIDQSKILAIMPIAEANAKFNPTETIKLPHHVLMPGLINLHTHAAMSLMRGLADDIALMPWLENHIWPAEKALVSDTFVFDGSLLACAEMLAGGVTCFNDMYFFPEATARAVKQSGIRANLGIVTLDFPTAYANDAEDYVAKGLAARDAWRHEPTIRFSLAPHAPYTVSDKSFQHVMTYAEQLDLGVHIHVHETLFEVQSSIETFGVRPLERLKQLGVLGPNTVAAHGVHLSQNEMELLQRYGCHVAHCPASNLKLASGLAKIDTLRNVGVNVGLGTDGAASNNRLDIFSEMRLAALLAKGVAENASAMPACHMLEMSTINAAKALGIEDMVGSLTIGKAADMIAINVDPIEMQPCFDPISHLVYVASREHVTHTWVNGRLCFQRLYQENPSGLGAVYASIETNELKEIIATWQPKLQAHHTTMSI